MSRLCLQARAWPITTSAIVPAVGGFSVANYYLCLAVCVATTNMQTNNN